MMLQCVTLRMVMAAMSVECCWPPWATLMYAAVDCSVLPVHAAVTSRLDALCALQASSSLKRGPATCLTCKGKGSCMCPVCQVLKAPALTQCANCLQWFSCGCWDQCVYVLMAECIIIKRHRLVMLVAIVVAATLLNSNSCVLFRVLASQTNTHTWTPSGTQLRS